LRGGIPSHLAAAAGAHAGCGPARSALNLLTPRRSICLHARRSLRGVWLYASGCAVRHGTTATRERFSHCGGWFWGGNNPTEAQMNGLIYLIGLIVVILAILSFFGLR
jgi:hypothetical protein